MHAPQPPSRVRFRSFELDLTSGELHRDGQKSALPSHAFEVLNALLERPGEVVTREELRARLWPGNAFGEFEDSLNHAVRKLRQELGDSADNPQFIETLPRKGYRFIAPAAPVESRAAAPARTARRPLRRVLAGVGLAVTVAAGVWLLANRSRREPSEAAVSPTRHAGRETLAVLPFVNSSGSPDAEYLCQGLSESLITDLSRLPNLTVLARDSVVRFAAQGGEIREIGPKLGASIVLRGRLTLGRDSVSIKAELIRTRDSALLWRQEYNRADGNVLEIEQRMARELVRQFQLKPGGEEQGRRAPPTTNPAAFRSYLLGRYFWNTRTEEDLRKGVEAFQQAIRQDPNYALAWAGLADSFLMLGAWSVLEPKDSYPRAKAAAARAIALDEALAEPHATFGYLKILYEWDWAGADQELRRAIELNPGYATAHHWYAFYFQTIGDIPQSLAEMETARRSDPLSPIINSEISYFYFCAKQYDRAEVNGRKIVELDPSFAIARIVLAQVYGAQGKRREAAMELEALSRLPPVGVVLLGDVAAVHALIGERDRARAILRELKERARQRYVYPAALAETYAALGENDQAIACLERALEDRSLVPSWLREPTFDPLRRTPRFRALFDRLGLKPEARLPL